METVNSFLEHWEALWLFLILFGELTVGSATLWILVKEWFYDKEIEERKYNRRLKSALKKSDKKFNKMYKRLARKNK